MKILVVRTRYDEKSTDGLMLLNDGYFCKTLEDVVRIGPKVIGQTAIPSGRYKVVLSLSQHFKILLPEILNVPGFSGVRIHGGNTDADTEGCILVAKNRLGPDNIQGSMSAALTDLLKQSGSEHEIQIINAWK